MSNLLIHYAWYIFYLLLFSSSYVSCNESYALFFRLVSVLAFFVSVISFFLFLYNRTIYNVVYALYIII